jgi:hypothetical protein
MRDWMKLCVVWQFWCSIVCLLLMHAGCGPTVPAPALTAAGPASAVPHVPEPSPQEPPAVEPITFERLDIGMEPDSVYQPWMMKHAVKVLDGKPVRIRGFMHGAVFQRNNIRTFHLMREKECPFGPGGQAHHAIEVEMQGKRRANFTTDEITVEGIFSIRPITGENGNTWSLYHLEGTSVQ